MHILNSRSKYIPYLQMHERFPLLKSIKKFILKNMGSTSFFKR